MRPCQGGMAHAGGPRPVSSRAAAAALVHGLLLVLPLYVVLEARLELGELEAQPVDGLGGHLVLRLLLLLLLARLLGARLLEELALPLRLAQHLGLAQREALGVGELHRLLHGGAAHALTRHAAVQRGALGGGGGGACRGRGRLLLGPGVGAPHADRVVPRGGDVLLLLRHVEDAAHGVRVAVVLLHEGAAVLGLVDSDGAVHRGHDEQAA
eukprot:scaffold66901_cov50-Phaeocystis_antarctica.AAC.3